MKLRVCEKCKHFKRKVWSTSYKPAGYHRIGVSHTYGWCELHKQRCLEIKKCKESNNELSHRH